MASSTTIKLRSLGIHGSAHAIPEGWTSKPVSQVVSILYALYKHFTWAFMLILLCLRVCLSMPGPPAPVFRPRVTGSSFHSARARLGGKQHSHPWNIFAVDWSGAWICVFLTKRKAVRIVTDFTSLWLATPLSRKETLHYFSLSLWWIVTHFHSLNQKTVRTCALTDNQRNCFSSSKMHGQNWSLGVLTGLFSKRESYKSRGCKVML